MAKSLLTKFPPRMIKGILHKMIKMAIGIWYVSCIKRARPVTPPSKKWLGTRKLFKAKAANNIPARLKIESLRISLFKNLLMNIY
jgi:hypothetical protein